MMQIGVFVITYILSSFNLVAPSHEQEIGMIEQQEVETVYYLIRHAEKDTAGGTDPDLSEAGKKRAAAWAEHFEDVPLDIIYSTKYRRTSQTANEIAESKELTTQFYEPQEIFSENFRSATKGKNVLIVGHSNTNPAFANFVLQANRFPDLKEDEYSALHILKISEEGEVESQLLKI